MTAADDIVQAVAKDGLDAFSAVWLAYRDADEDEVDQLVRSVNEHLIAADIYLEDPKRAQFLFHDGHVNAAHRDGWALDHAHDERAQARALAAAFVARHPEAPALAGRPPESLPAPDPTSPPLGGVETGQPRQPGSAPGLATIPERAW